MIAMTENRINVEAMVFGAMNRPMMVMVTSTETRTMMCGKNSSNV